MKNKLFFFLFLNMATFCFGQEVVGDSVKYTFHTELEYRELAKDSSNLIVQFGEDVLMVKIPFFDDFNYTIIDVRNEWIASVGDLSSDKKKFDELPDMVDSGKTFNLEKIEDVNYKQFECELYQVVIDSTKIQLYFEKKQSPNFNQIFLKILNLRGLPVKMDELPKGKFIAGMELKNGKSKDILELFRFKENQKINFTLKNDL